MRSGGAPSELLCGGTALGNLGVFCWFIVPYAPEELIHA
jgi:hypothetical protein